MIDGLTGLPVGRRTPPRVFTSPNGPGIAVGDHKASHQECVSFHNVRVISQQRLSRRSGM